MSTAPALLSTYTCNEMLHNAMKCNTMQWLIATSWPAYLRCERRGGWRDGIVDEHEDKPDADGETERHPVPHGEEVGAHEQAHVDGHDESSIRHRA